MVATITAPCCYCDTRLVFRPGPPDFKTPAWRHEDTGEVYAGDCSCEDDVHAGLYNALGLVQCKTWRDHHCATPDRSAR